VCVSLPAPLSPFLLQDDGSRLCDGGRAPPSWWRGATAGSLGHLGSGRGQESLPPASMRAARPSSASSPASRQERGEQRPEPPLMALPANQELTAVDLLFESRHSSRNTPNTPPPSTSSCRVGAAPLHLWEEAPAFNCAPSAADEGELD
jgi:hypothetical protein